MARRSYISIYDDDWSPLYTRPMPLAGFYSARLLKQQSSGRHATLL